MDSFRGSIPPNFISFYLENQTTEVADVPVRPATTTSAANPPTEAGPQIQNPSVSQELSRSRTDDITSTHSADSDPDVTSYAESMLQRMQQTQRIVTHEEKHPASALLQSQEQANDPPELVLTTAENRRSSTLIQSDEEEVQEADLSALESALKVIEASESQLPELRNKNNSDQVDASGIQSRTDEDNASSICDVPALPGGDPKVRFAVGLGDEEESTGESSRLVPVELYGRPPFGPEFETECEGDTGSEGQLLESGKTWTAGGSSHPDKLPDLSGRSRAILKEYFEEASPIRLPVGHTTVAFTEPQVYHLLRTLTDETLRKSFSTMERMVLDAVRGSPTALPSRTSHFQLKKRAQTPGPGTQSDSETESDPQGTVSDQLGSSSDDTGNASFYEETDSATEMDLITKSFKQTPAQPLDREIQTGAPDNQQQKGLEMEGPSSQDTTLHEMREQAQKDLGEGHSKLKKKKGNKKLSRRGVPMREEFFCKIGWTRSFISGPADPLHNPHMVWCHICKKNFSIKSKGPYEILRHHRTDRHLRRDQRWRYEHLRSVDPVSGKVQHRVRGANGKILTKIELANQLPKFINAELVDIGERFPFYEDFIRGTTSALVTQEARVKTQLCLVGDFMKTLGDLSVLRNLWARMGAFTNHQATVCDFDWGEERISVSIFSVTCPLGRVFPS